MGWVGVGGKKRVECDLVIPYGPVIRDYQTVITVKYGNIMHRASECHGGEWEGKGCWGGREKRTGTGKGGGRSTCSLM